MNSKEQYTHMLKIRKEAENLTTRLIDRRLSTLAHVGQSVLRKKMTHEWATESLNFLDGPMLGSLSLFLKDPWGAQLVEAKEDKLIFYNPKVATPRHQFELSRTLLSYSTWEIGKMLRTKINYNKNRLRHLAMQTAERKIKELEFEIKQKEQEVRRLSNLKTMHEKELQENRIAIENKTLELAAKKRVEAEAKQ